MTKPDQKYLAKFGKVLSMRKIGMKATYLACTPRPLSALSSQPFAREDPSPARNKRNTMRQSSFCSVTEKTEVLQGKYVSDKQNKIA